MSKITQEDLRMVEELHNKGFTDQEIAKVVGRSYKSVGQIIFHHKGKMDLIDRKWAKRLRRDREKETVERVIVHAQRDKNLYKSRQKQKSVWERMIGFFG